MYLKVIGKPVEDMSGVQHISAKYDPTTGVHAVQYSADVVTLGVVLGVLKREFEESLAALEPEMAARIKAITEEVTTDE